MAAESAPEPEHSQWTRRDVGDQAYLRLPVRTRWFGEGDDLVAALREFLPPLRAGDTVAVSEKVVLLLTGRTVPVTDAYAGRVARLLARWVRPPEGSYGLSAPAKMQFVLTSVSQGRLLAAIVASAVTRPLGVRGVFYRVAGPVARDVDGALPPYEHLLFPPLPADDAQAICAELQDALGVGVGIVDLNDFGGRVRGVSSMALRADELAHALADNPLRQRLTGTPFGVVRPLSRPAHLAAAGH
jgi:F420-0:gamma-glutamyl ligase